ncbi:hypothetical protein pb186bvf_020732 [Paramecium bursaria]
MFSQRLQDYYKRKKLQNFNQNRQSRFGFWQIMKWKF